MPPSRNEEWLAAALWDRLGGRIAPPRDLEDALWLLPDVSLYALNPVTSAGFRERLRREGDPLPPAEGADGRPLLGCVFAYRGRARIAVSSALPPDERRFVVAHELGHYLIDYLDPRERALRRLGPGARPVLDGARPAAETDEWAAVLAGVPTGLYAHYLGRDEEWHADGKGRGIERRADELALELLAPWAEVAPRLAESDAAGAEALLRDEYGLPPAHAAGYAGRLREYLERNRPASAQWGL